MTERVFIVTGTSRGLGAAMAGQLLQPGNLLLCISRRLNGDLAALARTGGGILEQWIRDLSDPVPVGDDLETWLTAREPTRFDEATLINNAAMLSRVGPVDLGSNLELSSALRVGLEATVLLTASFLRATQGWRAQRKVLNISSGLGRHAMAASAAYYAVKAGMDNFSRGVALDEAHRENGARIVSLAPGVIDTDMQVALRAADGREFPDQATFIGYKSSGRLSSPQDAAARVLRYLDRADFGAHPVADVRDA